MKYSSKEFDFQDDSGAGILAVIMLTGVLAGAAGIVSTKISRNSRLMHKEIRNPMSVELTDVPFFQVVNDDAICKTTNMMTDMGNFSLDGTLDSNLGNKIREMDTLTYEIAGVSNYVYERKLDQAGLYTKLGLKQYEMYQTGGIITDAVNSYSRIPVGFVKVEIISLGSGTTGGGTQNQNQNSDGSTANNSEYNGNKTTTGNTNSGQNSTTSSSGGGGGDTCKGKDARTAAEGAIAAFSKALEDADDRYSDFGFLIRRKKIVSGAKDAAMSYLENSGSPGCRDFIKDAIAAGIDAGISSVISSVSSFNFNNIVGKAVSASKAASTTFMQDKLGIPISLSASETVPDGWSEGDSGLVNESIVSVDGENFRIVRTIQSSMYIELTADLVAPDSCYSPVSSRSLCIDSGGVFDGGSSSKCTL